MRKRSNYRPRPVLINPVAYVIESMTPVAQHDGFLTDLKIKNSQAMLALLRGTATKDDIDKLIAMSNMTEALQQMGFGKDYRDVLLAGRAAVLGVVQRAKKHGRFTPTGREIQDMNMLMELHDAQMDVITVRDVEKAISMVMHEVATSKNTIRMETV